MTISELIQVAELRLAYLNSQLMVARLTGNLNQMQSLECEITDTDSTLKKLRTLIHE